MFSSPSHSDCLWDVPNGHSGRSDPGMKLNITTLSSTDTETPLLHTSSWSGAQVEEQTDISPLNKGIFVRLDM
jgi:hypothetical protein